MGASSLKRIKQVAGVVRDMVDLVRSSKWCCETNLSNGWGSQRGKGPNICEVTRNSEVEKERRV
jgi:hypothetical protein